MTTNKSNTGGGVAIRGFVIQSLVVLLEICQSNCIAIRFEPEGTDKVDFFWLDAENELHAVQVKSTANIFSKDQAQKWAKNLEGEIQQYVVNLSQSWVGSLNKSQLATEWSKYPKVDFKNVHCHLTLVGTSLSSSDSKVGGVEVNTKNFDGLKKYLPDTDIWSVAEHKIATLIHDEKGFTGTPAEWRQAIEWAVGKLQCGCNDVMTRDEFVEGLKRIVITGTPVSDFKKSLENYRQKQINELSTRKVFGDSRLLSDMFIEQRFSPVDGKRFDMAVKSPGFNIFDNQVDEEDCFKVIEDANYPRLFILSEPGMGKSSFVETLVLRYAQDAEKPVPILIQLKQQSKEEPFDMKSITDVVGISFQDGAAGKDFLRAMLQEGKALLILDGLDEIQFDKMNEVAGFLQRVNPARCLVTCRMSDGKEGTPFVKDLKFKRVQMEKFTTWQVKEFVGKWFREEKSDFLRQIENQKNLAELARQPLLLALMCLTFEQEHTLGKSRADIYEKAVDLLLRQWDKDRCIRRASCFANGGGIRQKKDLLSKLAYSNFQDSGYQISKQLLVKQIEAETTQDGDDVLDELSAHHGILVKQNNDNYQNNDDINYAFLHLTFQEYFTAKAISGNPEYQRELMRHVHEPRWREVFLLTAGLLTQEKADEFFTAFRQHLAKDKRLHPALRWAQNRKSTIGMAGNSATERFGYLLVSALRCKSQTLGGIIERRNPYPNKYPHDTIALGTALNLAQIIGLDMRCILDLDQHLTYLFSGGIGERDLASILKRATTSCNFGSTAQCVRNFECADSALGRDYLLLSMWWVVKKMSEAVFKYGGALMEGMRDFFKEIFLRLQNFGISVSLPIPDADVSKNDWKAYLAELETVLVQYDLRAWFNTEEEFRALGEYFYGNELLLQRGGLVISDSPISDSLAQPKPYRARQSEEQAYETNQTESRTWI